MAAIRIASLGALVGQLIAYTLASQTASGLALWLMRSDGSDQRLLLESVGEEKPSWRP